MAAGIAPGSVTELELGLRLFLIPAGVLASTLIAPLAATWAARVTDEGADALTASITRAVSVLLFVIPPLAVVGILLREHLITLLYAGGAYSASALHQTANAFGMLLLGLPAQVLVVVVTTLFIVRRDSIFPMKLAIANVILNVVLNFILRPVLGVGGIALSTTITLTSLVAVGVVVAQRRWNCFDLRRLRAPLQRAAASTAAIAVAGIWLLGTLDFSSDRAGAIGAVASVGVVAIVLHATVHLIGREPMNPTISARLRSLSPRSHV
jgi:putative peptidoglycan lipid II flippase